MANMGINQLAQMYMGNPQPLAAKVQQAQQQAKPGQIPPDLKEALALQQIQDMRQAAQNQQAMQAGGPQPTVVDQLKQMIAQQQQPQGMPQGLPQGAMMRAPQGMPQQMAPQPVPQGMAPSPQPPSEEQAGLPQLPSSLGQHLAGGGIIAFAGKDESYVPNSEEYYAEPLPAEARQNMDTGVLKKLQEYMSRNLERDPKTGEVVRNPETGEPMRKTSNDIPRAAAPEVSYGNESRREVMPVTQGLPSSSLVKQNLPVAPRSPVAPAAPVAPPPTVNAIAGNPPASEATSPVEQFLRNKFAVNEEDKGTAAVAKAKAAYGAPDTTGYDRAVEELNRRKAQFEAPKTGMPALMEYLQQIAQAPRGMGSLSAGAMGAQRVEDIQKQREATQFDLAKQILETEQKKADVTRGYAKELYGINTAAVANAGTEAYNAAIALHKSESEAKQLKQQAEQKELDRQNQLTIEREQQKGANARHIVPIENRVFQSYMEANGNNPVKAYEAMKIAGAAGKGVMTRDQAADNVRKDLENLQTSGPMLKEAKLALQANGIPNPTMQQVQEHLIQQQMKGVSLTGQPQPNNALFNKADAILAGSK